MSLQFLHLFGGRWGIRHWKESRIMFAVCVPPNLVNEFGDQMPQAVVNVVRFHCWTSANSVIGTRSILLHHVHVPWHVLPFGLYVKGIQNELGFSFCAIGNDAPNGSRLVASTCAEYGSLNHDWLTIGFDRCRRLGSIRRLGKIWIRDRYRGRRRRRRFADIGKHWRFAATLLVNDCIRRICGYRRSHRESFNSV